MLQVITRYPVLGHARLLAFVAAAALAVVSLAVSGDPAAAQGVFTGNPRK